MKVCKNCGNENPDKLVSCRFCNQPFPLSSSVTTITPSSSIPTTSRSTSIPTGPISPLPTGASYTPSPFLGSVSRSTAPYTYTLPKLYAKRYGFPHLQGVVQEVKDRRVNQKSAIPLILGGLIALKSFLNGLSMIYFGSNKEVTVTCLVIKEENTGMMREAILNQPQGSNPGIGNHLSLYGTKKNGVLIVKYGYNHDTDSEVICR